MPIGSLGYVGIRSDKLEDWASFGPQLLGLELTERTSTMLKFRMDDRKQRLVVTSNELPADVFGWEVDHAEALDELAARLEGVGYPVVEMTGAECALRGVTGGIKFSDPVGYLLEAFYGPEVADMDFNPGRYIAGFRTGPLGMGHAVRLVKSLNDVLWFYQDVLGFKVSDYILTPFRAYFFHVNQRHHSFAIAESDKSGIHHIMMELDQLDDVGQGYDVALAEPGRIATTFGRHSNDLMTSFYANSPSGFFVEYGWGGRSIDPDTWTPYEMKHGTSIWGHDRNWMSADQLAEARRLRQHAADEGLRAPVQVAEGNYQVGTSPCYWWEEMKQQK